MTTRILAGLITVYCLLFTACYSFKNVSLSPDIEFFSVDEFRQTARNAPAALAIDFSERLKDKIRNESRLNLNDDNPHLIYSGSLTRYQVRAIAPQPNETVAQNRLEIAVKVKFKNTLDEEKNWEQSFSYYEEFPAEDVLTDVQDDLIENIFDQLVEDIFNKSFGDW
jgi:hypothetical protein